MLNSRMHICFYVLFWIATKRLRLGLNDLKLAVGATRILNIPCGLVINRSDAGDRKVKEYATAEDIPVLMEIPFDRDIAEAYARGAMLVDVMPEWRAKFSRLYNKIMSLVER